MPTRKPELRFEWLCQLVNDMRSHSHGLAPDSEEYLLMMRVRVALNDLLQRVKVGGQ